MPKFSYHFRNNPEKLEELLTLRTFGCSYSVLADEYECPKLAIRHWCRKYGLGENSVTVSITRRDVPYTNVTTQHLFDDVTTSGTYDGPVNPGKTYKEYLAEAQARKQ